MRTSLLKLSLIGFISFSAAIPALAAVSKKLPNPVGYATLDQAGEAALRAVLSLGHSKRVEYGGCLYKSDGRYYYTMPVTDGDSSAFSASCELYPNDRFSGIYHNHPSGSEIGFSGHDINVAKQYGVTSYIAIMERGTREIVKYVPGQTRLECRVYRDGTVPDEHVCSLGDLVTRY